MSKLAEYRALEKALQEQLSQLDALKEDDGLKKEMQFEQLLRSLMGEYDKSLRDIIAILDPQRAPVRSTGPSARKARKLKVYRNPQTGDVIETKGGNHTGLKQWKAQYGADSTLTRTPIPRTSGQ